MSDPVKIKGRNRFADEALTKVTVSRLNWNEPLLIVKGGYIEDRRGGFLLAAKHPEATDEEGDASYVLHLVGAGLTWTGMYGNEHTFEGVLLGGGWVTNKDAAAFIEENGYLGFVPEKKEWTPDVYQIRIEHL